MHFQALASVEISFFFSYVFSRVRSKQPKQQLKKKQMNLLNMKGMLYAVRCLKSNEDMILALAGQFKQLTHEPEKFR